MKRMGKKKNGHDNPPPEGWKSAPGPSEAAPYAAEWKSEQLYVGVLIGFSAAVLLGVLGVLLSGGERPSASPDRLP